MSPGTGMSRLNCERLANLVREHPPLYDYTHPAHSNRDVTSGMWTEIATEMGVSEVTCKTKWSNLRSNFVRELRRIRPAEDGTMWPPQWPLFKPLMFLLPFLKKRGSSGPGVEESAFLHLQDYQDQVNTSDGKLYDNQKPNKKLRLETVPAEEDKDDDKLFMLSLVPKMKQLSTIDNVSFRIEVQQLLLNKLRQSQEESTEGPQTMQSVQVVFHDALDNTVYEEVVVKEETVERLSTAIYDNDNNIQLL